MMNDQEKAKFDELQKNIARIQADAGIAQRSSELAEMKAQADLAARVGNKIASAKRLADADRDRLVDARMAQKKAAKVEHEEAVRRAKGAFDKATRRADTEYENARTAVYDQYNRTAALLNVGYEDSKRLIVESAAAERRKINETAIAQIAPLLTEALRIENGEPKSALESAPAEVSDGIP